MGAICPASLHTCHPDLIRTWETLRSSWLSLFKGPCPARNKNGHLSALTFDSLRIARTSEKNIPPVEGCGKAASIFLEHPSELSVEMGPQSGPIPEPLENYWLSHIAKASIHANSQGQKTVCTLFTSSRPCYDDRAHRYLINFGHEYIKRGKKPPPQFVHKQQQVRLKIAFFLDMFAGEHAPISVAVRDRMGRALIPQ